MRQRRRLAGGMAWNLVGSALPVAAALVAVPILMSRMGASRFGLLTFVWMIVGYSALLDLGIGRALTHGVAERLGRDDVADVPAVVRGGIKLLVLVGLGGLALLWLGSGWVAGTFLKVPRELVGDAERALRVAAIIVPTVVLASAFRGVLEAYQRFRFLSVVRAGSGFLVFATPVVVLAFSERVSAVVAVLGAVRALELACYAAYGAALVPGLASWTERKAVALGPLFRFGLWSTLNNLVGGLMAMAYVDRLYISGTLGTDALAFFATPFDVVAKTLIAPAAIVGVLFPAFSSLGLGASAQARSVAMQAIRLIVFGTAPVFLLFLGAAEPLLTLWLGLDVAARSWTTFRLVSVGTLAVSMAYVPFAFIQAMGRPDLTAKRHFVELPFYLAASFVAVRTLGTTGSSLVWCTWAVLDFAFILRIMRRVAPSRGPTIAAQGWIALGGFLAGAYLAGLLGGTWWKLAAGALAPACFLAWAWHRWLAPEDRVLISGWIPAPLRLRVGVDGRER